MSTISMTIGEIHMLALKALLSSGCDEANAQAIATTVSTAERDGSESHGLFRLPGYITSFQSGRVNGKAKPKAERVTPAVIRVHGDNGYAPYAYEIGIPLLVEAAAELGVAVLALTHTHHFAALWPEVEAIAAHDLVGMACTAYKPSVAPAGATEPLFGTNPLAFAWPRPGKNPLVFDMATAARAQGDVQIAMREGHAVPIGTGLDADGNDTTDPAKILDGGVLLPFGGYKGSAIAMMVELLCAGLINERFSFEAAEEDVQDSGPPRGGEFLLAMSPKIIAGDGWADHTEGFFAKLENMDGVRLPGQRRHLNRLSDAPREVNAALIETIRGLVE